MSINFFIRIIGMFVFGIMTGYWGFWFGSTNAAEQVWTYTFGLGTVGAGVTITARSTASGTRAMLEYALMPSTWLCRLLTG